MHDFSIMLPTEEEMQAAMEARRAFMRSGGPDTFCPLDLGDWIDLAHRADVPAVPAIKIAEADTVGLWESVDAEGDPVPGVAGFYADVQAFQNYAEPGWMLRWSCCSMAEVKMRLSGGDASWSRELMDLYVGDMRAFDIISDFPRPLLAAWARPWLTFDAIDGYPVEYRVFVENSTVVGVSNYYPQRPLPDDERTRADVERIADHTYRMIFAQKARTHLPHIEKHVDLTRNWFTADFARLPSGALLFLEGGPPHTPRWGAHPCCFPAGNTRGIALAAPVQEGA